MKSTDPIKYMEEVTGIQPLQKRRNTNTLLPAHKYECLPDHSIKMKLQAFTKNRLKRSSFVHEAKKLKKQNHALVLGVPSTPLGIADIMNPVEVDLSAVNVNLNEGTLH